MTINNIQTKKFPLLSMIIDSNDIKFSIRSARLLKSKTFHVDRKSVNNALRQIFTELDLVGSKSGIHNVKISAEDEIFEKISAQDLINLANKCLKQVTIWINQPITEITDKTRQAELINHFHNHRIEGGHVGQKRLYSKLRSQYKWKNTSKDIAKFVNNCSKCRVNKPKVKNTEELTITDTPTRPFQYVSIDTIGPMPSSVNQAKYAVTIICEFSKHLFIEPIPNKESKTIAKILLTLET